ncbi:hypothetical protein PoB_007473800 [Plakobranchus ocellatus]|uniref:Uncharacterized protein n=1 Tax=Plakobranchus ocellatus TaxID=259542 RepID=A0AAV4DVX1_9GAST|nr:hypothetical protein PoB_007473800 [Plakobranchus ocellatus]
MTPNVSNYCNGGRRDDDGGWDGCGGGGGGGGGGVAADTIAVAAAAVDDDDGHASPSYLCLGRQALSSPNPNTPLPSVDISLSGQEKLAPGLAVERSCMAASGGVGGTVVCESALRSAGTLLSRVRALLLAPRPDRGPKSLRSPCFGLAIHKTYGLI